MARTVYLSTPPSHRRADNATFTVYTTIHLGVLISKTLQNPVFICIAVSENLFQSYLNLMLSVMFIITGRAWHNRQKVEHYDYLFHDRRQACVHSIVYFDVTSSLCEHNSLIFLLHANISFRLVLSRINHWRLSDYTMQIMTQESMMPLSLWMPLRQWYVSYYTRLARDG